MDPARILLLFIVAAMVIGFVALFKPRAALVPAILLVLLFAYSVREWRKAPSTYGLMGN